MLFSVHHLDGTVMSVGWSSSSHAHLQTFQNSCRPLLHLILCGCHISVHVIVILSMIDQYHGHFKVATLTYKVISTQQPAYLYNLISYHQSGHLLRSSSQSLLHVPRIKTAFGRHAFSSAAAQVWNHIPTAIRASASLDSFKRHLKTHYFASP